MRKALKNQTLKKRSIEFKAVTLLNTEVVVVDFRMRLPVNVNVSNVSEK